MLYGMETIPLTKSLESRLEVAEMKMLRFSQGVTKFDKMKNVDIRQNMAVVRLGEKAKEWRLRWYGHVRRREETHVCQKVLKLTLPGARKRGRPKRRYMDNIREDMVEKGVTENDAKDRTKWRNLMHCGDPLM
jgi:hypothetical protein